MISRNKLISLTSALMLSSGLVYAEEQVAQKDFHVTLSAKAWANDWNAWDLVSNAGTNSVVASKVPFIGGVSVKYGDFFLSGNYSPETDYDFSRYAFAPNGKRKEYDLSLGYYIHPQIALAVGYKNVRMSYYTPGVAVAPAVWEYKFPMIGISANAPITNTQAFMYGSGAIGIGGSIAAPAFALPSGPKDPTYRAVELGLGYIITNGLAATIGYKYQELGLGWTNIRAKSRDVTSGLMFGLAYTF